jgi:hypothetical protein
LSAVIAYLSLSVLGRLKRIYAVTVFYLTTRPLPGPSYTTPVDVAAAARVHELEVRCVHSVRVGDSAFDKSAKSPSLDVS